jgi:predicted transcriptional regulator
MEEMLKRHEIQVPRKAEHPQGEVAKLAGVSESAVRRVERELFVITVDDAAERQRRRIGRKVVASRQSSAHVYTAFR